MLVSKLSTGKFIPSETRWAWHGRTIAPVVTAMYNKASKIDGEIAQVERHHFCVRCFIFVNRLGQQLGEKVAQSLHRKRREPPGFSCGVQSELFVFN